ncbi:hypothetical protein [Mucilaginibacter pocheonensis]|uniref:Uncharacterized protein n=1 Tax=Mucilaginibacter pocheonensis TaxID=398050 RepID=A0ABU1T9Y3_9SPHI|nr:hypothetical protein [Mucilaginibacter pocheonensis]MDR6941686.1 hypothetical protein [Mucilaginibacter pocheonensis]
MKKIILLILMLHVFKFLHAQQQPYYDAVQLARLLDSNKHFINAAIYKDTLYSVLKKYIGGSITSASEFKNPAKNPFIASYFDEAQTYSTGFSPLNLASGGLKAIGDLKVNNIADGLAQFLIERGKEELDIAFIERFKDFLKNYPEARIAFPTTVGFINSIESYNYNAMLPALKAAFQKDLNSLSENLLKLREITADEIYIAANEKSPKDRSRSEQALVTRVDKLNAFWGTLAGRAALGTIIISDGLVKGTNPVNVIDDLSKDPAFAQPSFPDNLSNSIQLMELISQSLKSTDTDRFWITKTQVRDLLEEDTFRLYLGLLYAQNQSQYHIQFGTTTPITLETFLTDLNKNWPSQKSRFGQQFSTLANGASEASDRFKDILAIKDKNDQSGILLYANYASAVSVFLKTTATIVPSNLPSAQAGNVKKDLATYMELADNLVNSIYYVKSQNYAALILSTSMVFTTLAEYGTPDEKDKYIQFKNGYIKYGTFMANILEAKNGEEVKAAIEVVALPAGSYSIKQKSAWNVSFNGYVGYGYDFNYANGVYAPIGFAGTWGSKRNGIPITIFASLIDLGSLVSYRLKDNSTEQLKQDVRLESIISLSAQAIFEIPKTPIAIAAGWKRTPKLFYSGNSTFDVKPPKNVFNLSLLIDIPIFTLHNKSF